MDVKKINKFLCMTFFGFVALCGGLALRNWISSFGDSSGYDAPRKIPMQALAEPVHLEGSCGTNAQWSFDSEIGRAHV